MTMTREEFNDYRNRMYAVKQAMTQKAFMHHMEELRRLDQLADLTYLQWGHAPEYLTQKRVECLLSEWQDIQTTLLLTGGVPHDT